MAAKTILVAALASLALVGCGEQSQVGDSPAAANSTSATELGAQRGRTRAPGGNSGPMGEKASVGADGPAGK